MLFRINIKSFRGIKVIKNDKVYRVLEMYTKLMEGKILNKAEEAKHYDVNERSIQRDIESIRDFLHHKVEKEGVHTSVGRIFCMILSWFSSSR